MPSNLYAFKLAFSLVGGLFLLACPPARAELWDYAEEESLDLTAERKHNPPRQLRDQNVTVDAAHSSLVIPNISSWNSSYEFSCKRGQSDCPLRFKVRALDALGLPLGIEIEGRGEFGAESNRVNSLKVKRYKPEDLTGPESLKETTIDENLLKNALEFDINEYRRKKEAEDR